jgi:hypothetical protein
MRGWLLTVKMGFSFFLALAALGAQALQALAQMVMLQETAAMVAQGRE